MPWFKFLSTQANDSQWKEWEILPSRENVTIYGDICQYNTGKGVVQHPLCLIKYLTTNNSMFRYVIRCLGRETLLQAEIIITDFLQLNLIFKNQ